MHTGLSIIIVNYKAVDLIQNCLASIYSFTNNLDFEIIIVDNSSSERDKESVLQNFPNVRWVPMNYNSGFARANNEGIRQAKGDVVLLLNPDILLEGNDIANCFSQFVSSSYVACGVQLLNTDGTPQISGNYFMKGGLNHLLPLPYLGKFLRWIAGLFKVKKPHVSNAKDTVEVDWINGAFLMVKKTAIEKVGLLDEDFFLYAEEAEWCHRLGKHGRLCIFGNCHVTHLQGESANEAFDSEGKGYMNLFDRKGLQIMVSNALRIRKHYGVLWFLFHLIMLLLDIPVFLFGLSVSKFFSPRFSKYSWEQFRGYLKNVMDLLRLSKKIISNKQYFYKVL